MKTHPASEYRLYKHPEYANRARIKKKATGRSKIATKVFINPKREKVNRKLLYENLDEGYYTGIKDKFCDLTGFESVNTHPKSYLNYLDHFVFKYMKSMPNNVKDELRNLRNIKQGF